MANVAHSTLTGSNLHENKGVASASDNTVATASGGATVWQKLTHNHLTTTGNPFGGQLLHVKDSAALNLPTINSWVQRPLTSAVTNEISSASLSSNQISLPAGTYFVQASLSGRWNYSLNAAATPMIVLGRLYNTTTAASILDSNPFGLEISGPSVIFFTPSFLLNIMGRFTLAGTSTLEFQHNSTLTVGSSTISGGTITNTQACIWKVG